MFDPIIYMYPVSESGFTANFYNEMRQAAGDMQIERIAAGDNIPEKCILIYVTDSLEEIQSFDATGKYLHFVYHGPINSAVLSEPLIDAIVHDVNHEEHVRCVARKLAWHISNAYHAHLDISLLQTLIDSSPDMVWFKDRDGRHVILNRMFGEVVGKEVSDCLGKEHPYIWNISQEEYEKSDFSCRASEEEIMRTGKPGVFEEQVLKGKRVGQYTVYKTPICNVFGEVIGTCGIGHDTTDLDNMGYEMDILLAGLPFPVFICDLNQDIIRKNKAAESIMGSGMSAIKNYRTWSDFCLHKPSVDIGMEDNVFSLRRGVIESFYSVMENVISDVFGNVIGYMHVLRDVTYRRMYDKMLFDAANVDPLTGLYNRRYFYDAINRSRGVEMTMLYGDLDHFKAVNDELGHAKGDAVLRAAADLLRRNFSDGIVCRLGGDEFAILLPRGLDLTQYEQLVNRLNDNIQTFAPDCSKKLGMSVGYIYTESLDDAEEFLKAGDAMMYDIKRKRHRA